MSKAASPRPRKADAASLDIGHGPLASLKRAAARAFPGRAELARLQLDGSYKQAWQALSRVLGIDERDLARKIAPLLGLEHAARLDGIASPVLALVPFAFCQSHGVLPLRTDGNALVVATANPFDGNVAERVAFMVNRPVRWALCPPETLDDAVLAAFSRQAARDAGGGSGASAASDIDDAIVRLARALLSSAVDARASDLHIQPYVGSAMVRIRVDGELRRLANLTDAVAATLVRHVKAISGMESTNAQVPQDGRMSMVIGDRDFDMRVSTLPATRGERLVIRFLDQTRVHRLSTGGFSVAALQALRRQISRVAGLVIMTGPTGCGKTSTLYGMLSELNRGSVNLITVENPVEYRIPGISQVEVNDKAGRTFAVALRSILRQDPDVILVGEIRDRETAEIAVQAALTGHLVLTTLHTSDAVTAIPRLLDLGLPPTILADALAAIAAQRLCRVLCTACKAPVAEPLTPAERAFRHVTHHLPGARAAGCPQCDYTGYRGRLPIVDILEVGPRLREAIAAGEARVAVLEAAREGGLKSLAASGGLQVVSGLTTVEEVLGAVGPSFWPELAAYYGTTLSAEDLDILPHAAASLPGVVLITENAALAQSLQDPLQAADHAVHVVRDPEAANAVFRQEDNVAFVVMDIADGATLPEAIETLRAAGRAMYWSRLPALVLLPPPLAAQEREIHESGVISPCLAKPAAPEAVLQAIRRSHAR